MLRLEFEIDTSATRRDIENLFYETLSHIHRELPLNKVVGRIVAMQVPDGECNQVVDGDRWKR